MHFPWQPNPHIMKHSVPILHRPAASTVHQMQRDVLKYLRKASLNHRNLPRTGGHWNAWIQLQQFYCLSRADGFFFPSSFLVSGTTVYFWMQVFNNLAGSGPDANECRWSSQQLEWSAWVEMADYTVLQAKRMIAVIHLTMLSREISRECVEKRGLAAFATHVHICSVWLSHVRAHCHLVNASEAHNMSEI